MINDRGPLLSLLLFAYRFLAYCVSAAAMTTIDEKTSTIFAASPIMENLLPRTMSAGIVPVL